MKIKISSELNRPTKEVWSYVELSSTLVKVAWPMAQIEPANGKRFPEKWIQNEKVYCRSYLFGIFFVGTRSIFFEKIDGVNFQLQSRESDQLIKQWDHLISITPTSSYSCVYSDEIEIDAGFITPIVCLWARLFYLHRQSRWKKLLSNGL